MNALLERTVGVLEPLANRLVFVGHHVTSLLLTDRGAVRSRPTFSIDAVVSALSYSSRERLATDVTRLGLRPEGGVPSGSGRWITGDGLTLDLIPTDALPAGAQPELYEYALDCTLAVPLGARAIRIAGAPAFLALKLAAVSPALLGIADFNADLEDALAVLDGRAGVEREIADAPSDVRRLIGERLGAIGNRPDADCLLQGHIRDAGRFPQTVEASLARLHRIAAL
jgi:hypothetical protein